MDIQRAVMMATDLMNYHGLYGVRGWQFKLTRSMSSLGAIRPKQRVLCLSKPYATHNSEDSVLDTILHEIAHVLTFQEIHEIGNREWHGPIWKRKAREIGARPETCASEKGIVLPTKWVGECMDCGATCHRQRDPSPMTLLVGRHGACGHKANCGKLKWLCNGKPWPSTKVPLSTIDATQASV